MSNVTKLLEKLPRTERRDALESLVVKEFRAALMMSEDEHLPLDQSFFELGLTSLRITDLKQTLEELVGREISANVLFNSPTVDELMAYLTGTVVADLFEARPVQPETAPSTAAPQKEAVADLLKDLYQA